MRAIAWLLRVFCYFFQTMISVSLLGLGALAALAGAKSMKLQTLPWEGAQLNHWLIGLGIAGLLSVILALMDKLRVLLVLWSICVFGMLVRAVFLSPAMTFSGPGDFHNWLWLTGGAGVATIGSWLALTRRRI
jgi:hypothetical protein